MHFPETRQFRLHVFASLICFSIADSRFSQLFHARVFPDIPLAQLSSPAALGLDRTRRWILLKHDVVSLSSSQKVCSLPVMKHGLNQAASSQNVFFLVMVFTVTEVCQTGPGWCSMAGGIRRTKTRCWFQKALDALGFTGTEGVEPRISCGQCIFTSFGLEGAESMKWSAKMAWKIQHICRNCMKQ